jgi:hypothetical protein
MNSVNKSISNSNLFIDSIRRLIDLILIKVRNAISCCTASSYYGVFTLIGLLFLLSLACYLVDSLSFTRVYASGPVDSNTSNPNEIKAINYSTFSNPENGIRIKYPTGWSLMDDPALINRVQTNTIGPNKSGHPIALFFPPPVGLFPDVSFAILVDTKPSPTLKKYVDDSQLEFKIFSPTFEITSINPTSVHRIPAYKWEGVGTLDIGNMVKKYGLSMPKQSIPLLSSNFAEIKMMEIIAIQNNKGYRLLYISNFLSPNATSSYSFYLPVIYNMIKSFQIVN